MPRNRFTAEFRARNFLLEHPDPSYFTTAEWKWPPIIYVIYRQVVAVYFLVWLVLSGATSSYGPRWFLYLTNWSFLMLTLVTVVQAATSMYDYIQTLRKVKDKETDASATMTWYLKAQWLIYNIVTFAALYVTIAYWGLLYQAGNPVDPVNFTVHAFNSIYILIDFFITAMPVRLLHFWYGVLYGLLYVVFSLIYLGAGGTDKAGNNYIYSILDFFGKPATAFTVAALSVFVLAPLLWLLIYGIFNLRTFMSRKCCSCGRDYQKEYTISQPPSVGALSANQGPTKQEPTVQTIKVDDPTITSSDLANGTATTGTANGIYNTAFESEKE